jgi:hypothetical protein
MSEGLYSNVANYGGRQPDNYQNIKQFNEHLNYFTQTKHTNAEEKA